MLKIKKKLSECFTLFKKSIIINLIILRLILHYKCTVAFVSVFPVSVRMNDKLMNIQITLMIFKNTNITLIIINPKLCFLRVFFLLFYRLTFVPLFYLFIFFEAP